MRLDWLRLVSSRLGWLALAVLFMIQGRGSEAQESKVVSNSPARFVQSDGLVMFAQFDGLDEHAEGWRKTAAYKILNETSTGAMLEEVVGQALTQTWKGSTSGPEKLAIFKHLARSGFVVGLNVSGANGQQGAIVLVLRKAFSNKEVRPLFARILQDLPAAGTKLQAVNKTGHKLVTGKRGLQGIFAWWVEETRKEDLIVVFGPPGADEFVLEAVDGKKPSVVTLPRLANLAEPRSGLDRAFLGWLIPASATNPLATPQPKLRFDETKAGWFDLSAGFQDEALLSIARFHPPTEPPTKIQLTNTFDRTTIPNLPSGLLGFAVLALDMKSLPARMNSNPQLQQAYAQAVTTLQQKTKIQLERDILAQLGPKLTAYLTPAKSAATGGSMLPNALSMLSGMGGASVDGLPKVALLMDVVDPKVFGTTLDQLMQYVNRELKTAFAAPLPAGSEPAPAGGSGRNRGGPPAAPTPEFRVVSGETKSYVFTVPPEMASKFPAGLRPTIRLGSKQMAVALSPEAARQALESKGNYTPPDELAPAFARLPAQLGMLLVADPRGSTPEILASFPAKLQAGLNTFLPATPPAAGTPASPPAGAAPNAPGQLILQVDPGKLPSAEAIRRLLFPAILTVDNDGDALRITSRSAFPMIPDPSILGLFGRGIFDRIKSSAAPGGVAMPGAAPATTDGFFDVPARDKTVAPPAASPPTPSRKLRMESTGVGVGSDRPR